MYLLLLALCVLGSLERVLCTTCLCTHHVESKVMSCQAGSSQWFTSLYGNDYDEKCLPYAGAVQTNPGWKAVVGYNKVGYVQYDSNFYFQACTKTLGTAIEYDHSCKPTLRFGLTFPLKTTPPPTTTTTTTTPRPTTPTTTQKLIAVVPTQVYSKKCEIMKVLTHMGTGAPPASHPNAMICSDNTRTSSSALVFEACSGAHPDLTHWQKGLQVAANCNKIPRGEPLGYFMGNQIVSGISAIFWGCTPTSFEVVFQYCKLPTAKKDVKDLPFAKDFFYTVNW